MRAYTHYFFNRYTQNIEPEKTPGACILRFLYHTWAGKAVLCVIKNTWVSWCVGQWMNTAFSKRYIRPFAKKYGIDCNQFVKSQDAYCHFNDFFYRSFKSGERPIVPDPDVICFPCDGRHLGFQTFIDAQQFCIKNASLDLASLLQDAALTERFQQGTCVISRLAPVDYHRFHFPCDGSPHPTRLINGFLHSVHPLALRNNFKILSENRRWLTLMETERCGWVAMLEIGACCVGSVRETFKPNHSVQKGDEKGYFLFGGSTVITLFQPHRIRLSQDLIHLTGSGLELYAHVGDHMGRIC